MIYKHAQNMDTKGYEPVFCVLHNTSAAKLQISLHCIGYFNERRVHCICLFELTLG